MSAPLPHAATAPRRSLRILVVGLRYPPYIAGGYEMLTRDTVEGLRSRGHRVDVLCAKGKRFGEDGAVYAELYPELDGDTELFERSFRASNWERVRLHLLRAANRRATARVLASTQPDVLFYLNLSLLSLAPVLAARLAGVPTIGLVCDPWPTNHWLRFWRERGPHKNLRRGVLEHLWRTLRAAVRLEPMLVPSESLRAEFVADGLDGAGLHCLRLAMSPEMEELAAPMQVRARAEGEPLRVLTASYLWEGKGVHVVLEAAAQAAARGASLELHVAGNGQEPYVARLRELAASPALLGRVHFLGSLSRNELSKAMGQCHVLAFPSLWGEPYALATLEAMGHGLALLGSDAGGTPEQVQHGVTGWIAPKGDVGAWSDALERLARDEPLRRTLAQAGRDHAFREHSQASYLDRLEVQLFRAAGDGATP